MQTKKPAIIFDLDGTLIQTEALYRRAKEEFHTLMTTAVPGVTRDESELVLDAVDIQNTRYGWIRHRFPGSMAEAYLALCARYNHPYDAPVIARSVQIGYQVFDWKAELMPEVGTVLATLHSTHTLYLYTLGDPEVQQQRIRDFPLSTFFKDIGIPVVKDALALKQYLGLHRINPKAAWYVGDSLRSDIAPALENGLQAVLVEGDTWSYNHVEVSGEFYRAKTLAQVPSIILKQGAAVA